MESLESLATMIDSHRDWWRFPQEGPVKGFMGDAPLFIVGDQPSTSEWAQSHPNRRAFYDRLPRVGAADAHLTDLYKRRGKSNELRQNLPTDFAQHLAVFRCELNLIKPTLVVALGGLTRELLSRHVPEVRPILRTMWHFAYPVRYGRLDEYEANMRSALKDWTR
jgi:hypothetical protein